MIMLTERGVIVQGYREVFMKKWWILAGILVLLGGCSQVEHKSAEMEREETPPLDPAVEVEGIEAFARLGADIDVPAGAENAKYYIISDRIAEIQFSQNGVQYSYRASQMDEATGVQGVQQVAFKNVFRIDKLPVLGDIPFIGEVLFQKYYLTTYLGILILIVSWIVIEKTRFGLRLRACGENPHAADSVGINVTKMRYFGVMISGALGGLGGLVFVVPTSTTFNATVAGYGFLALAVLIFGQWHPGRIAVAAFFFGMMKTIAAAYSGIPVLMDLGLPDTVYKIIPYVATIAVLMFTSKNSKSPAASGVPYNKGER